MKKNGLLITDWQRDAYYLPDHRQTVYIIPELLDPQPSKAQYEKWGDPFTSKKSFEDIFTMKIKPLTINLPQAGILDPSGPPGLYGPAVWGAPNLLAAGAGLPFGQSKNSSGI